MSKIDWLYDFSESVAARMEVLLREASGFSELQRIQAIYFMPISFLISIYNPVPSGN